ncbi:MAG: DUF2680 domain-containing protein [Lachnoclostridium sp.]|jgi:ribosomal protein S20
MDKGKIRGLVIAGIIGLMSISPITTFAAELDKESVTQTDREVLENRSVKEKMKRASEKWNTLSEQQKEEIYSLMKQEMEAEAKIIDKLAELEILDKEDAQKLKAHMQERYNKIKESGEFPFKKGCREKSR